MVASLYQMPVDPFDEATHRPPDFWGRNLLDYLIRLLPGLLAQDGRAYLMQLSILSQLRTAERVEAHGLEARVVDVGFFPMSELFLENREQIARTEQLSDAWHLELGRSGRHGRLPPRAHPPARSAQVTGSGWYPHGEREPLDGG